MKTGPRSDHVGDERAAKLVAVHFHRAGVDDPQTHGATLRALPARSGLVRVGLTIAALALSGCSSDEAPAADPARSYTVELSIDDSEDEYRYVASGSTPIDIRAGDEVTFDLTNTGTLPHDLVVVDPAGGTIASAAAIGPGATTTVTVLFEEPGFYGLRCLVDDHLTTHGMQTFVEVAEPAP